MRDEKVSLGSYASSSLLRLCFRCCLHTHPPNFAAASFLCFDIDADTFAFSALPQLHAKKSLLL